ncbi:2Fe-2S iron-sulfur cluster-binding protein [Streptomyces violaceorubidus]
MSSTGRLAQRRHRGRRPEAGPPPLTPDEIRERMSGNLCRCGAYVSVQAVTRAAEAHEAAAHDDDRADRRETTEETAA